MDKRYLDYSLDQLEKLISIPSPSGFTDKISEYVFDELAGIGYQPVKTNKGGVWTILAEGTAIDRAAGTQKACPDEGALLISCHLDTLGGMVRQIKENGRLKITPLGYLSANNTESSALMIHTRNGKVYEGTFQMEAPSFHINANYETTPRTFDSLEVVIDEDVNSQEEVKALGISVGDIVSFDPKFHLTESGYIKSRFLDDKLACAILLAYAKFLKECIFKPSRKIYLHFTVFEEVSHGACGFCPDDVTDFLAVDMACVGPGLEATEHTAAICAKDIDGPSNYEMVSKLKAAADQAGLVCPIDVFENYASDADMIVRSGADVRHCTMGPGVYASHGYERAHIDGLKETFDLITAFVS